MKRILNFGVLCLLAFVGCTKPETPLLSVTSGKQIQFNVDGGSSNISFTTNQPWSAVSSSDWCSLSQVSGEQGSITVNVACLPNPEYRVRECSVTIVAAGLYYLVNITQAPKVKVEPVPISSKIYGEWVVKKGEITGFLSEAMYSQTIEFKENGNFEETVYTRTDYYDRERVVCGSSKTWGNWGGADGIISVNDWDSSIVVEGIKVVSVSDDELVLEFKDHRLSYVRSSAEFSNLETDILGSWYGIAESDYKGGLRLEEDGTGSIYQYYHSNSIGYYMTNNYNFRKWWIQDNALHADCIGSVLPFAIYFDFINEKYIGIRSYEVMERN